MPVSVYACVRDSMCPCLCLCTHVCVRKCVHACVNVWLCVCESTYIYIYVCVCVCVCESLCLRICVGADVQTVPGQSWSHQLGHVCWNLHPPKHQDHQYPLHLLPLLSSCAFLAKTQTTTETLHWRPKQSRDLVSVSEYELWKLTFPRQTAGNLTKWHSWWPFCLKFSPPWLHHVSRTVYSHHLNTEVKCCHLSVYIMYLDPFPFPKNSLHLRII